MNGEEFYAEFKEALRYLGVEWGNKEVVTMKLVPDAIVLHYGHREARIYMVGERHG